MNFNFEYKNRVLNLPGAVTEKIGKAGKTELEVLIILAGSGNEYNADEIAGVLGITASEVETAVNFWRGAGIIDFDVDPSLPAIEKHTVGNTTVSVLRSGDMPQYSGQELEEIFGKNPEMKYLIDEIQRTFGKMLNNSELNKVVGLADSYRFSVEYILLLARYVNDNNRGTVPYLVSSAKKLYDGGIFTVEALEEQIKDDEDRKTLESRVKTLFGIGSRKFTTNEKKYIDNWSKMTVSDEILVLAYEVTVDNTGTPSFPYMNKVLTNWKEAGYRTAEDISAALESYKKSKESAKTASFNENEFFEAALKHSMEIHRKK